MTTQRIEAVFDQLPCGEGFAEVTMMLHFEWYGQGGRVDLNLVSRELIHAVIDFPEDELSIEFHDDEIQKWSNESCDAFINLVDEDDCYGKFEWPDEPEIPF